MHLFESRGDPNQLITSSGAILLFMHELISYVLDYHSLSGWTTNINTRELSLICGNERFYTKSIATAVGHHCAIRSGISEAERCGFNRSRFLSEITPNARNYTAYFLYQMDSNLTFIFHISFAAFLCIRVVEANRSFLVDDIVRALSDVYYQTHYFSFRCPSDLEADSVAYNEQHRFLHSLSDDDGFGDADDD
ncbi:hypothetical protein CDAR_545471 [Caerostris darwini]|uniref:Uncharacterized protein n=1 Tax=Caerostris darwini TaxID=1538125 RepID=A0AAV4RLH6_9ARAC|nr:hypothetical protein CDAR_545471 [Caerostris darwini]